MTDPLEWLEAEPVNENTLKAWENGHGDRVAIRDTYDNPVQLSTSCENRYKVVYEPDEEAMVSIGGTLLSDMAEDYFGQPGEAFEYAVNVLMGESLEEYVEEDDYL